MASGLRQGGGDRRLADVGLRHDRLHDVAHPRTLRYDDQVLHQVLGVHQHGQRLAGLHLLLHLVVADLDVAGALVTRRRVVERVDALHHVRLLELTADLRGGGALLDLVEHRALPRPCVVGWRSEPAAQLAECPATGEGHDHDHDGQHDQHRTASTAPPGAVRPRARRAGRPRRARPRAGRRSRRQGRGRGPSWGPRWAPSWNGHPSRGRSGSTLPPTRSWPRRGPAPRRTRRSAVPARGLPARSRRQQPCRPRPGASCPSVPASGAAPRQSPCSGARRTT